MTAIADRQSIASRKNNVASQTCNERRGASENRCHKMLSRSCYKFEMQVKNNWEVKYKGTWNHTDCKCSREIWRRMHHLQLSMSFTLHTWHTVSITSRSRSIWHSHINRPRKCQLWNSFNSRSVQDRDSRWGRQSHSWICRSTSWIATEYN